jgi:hydroxypyruvate isomerase
MPRLAANLSTLFTEIDFPARVDAARRAGFEAVECQFPYDQPLEQLARSKRQSGVEWVLLNAPAGDLGAGEFGLACLPGREQEFEAGLETARRYATGLDCRLVHVMAGIPSPGSNAGACRRRYIDNLRSACRTLGSSGLAVTIEPINPRDRPGYFLVTQDQALATIDAVGESNLFLQFDLYHCRMTEGDVERRLDQVLPWIAHVQVAGYPGRAEPDSGDGSMLAFLDRLDRIGYRGWVGCEYRPAVDTAAGLGWARRYGVRPRAGPMG